MGEFVEVSKIGELKDGTMKAVNAKILGWTTAHTPEYPIASTPLKSFSHDALL